MFYINRSEVYTLTDLVDQICIGGKNIRPESWTCAYYTLYSYFRQNAIAIKRGIFIAKDISNMLVCDQYNTIFLVCKAIDLHLQENPSKMALSAKGSKTDKAITSTA